MFLLLIHITRLFYREVRFISKDHVGVLCSYTICSRHDIAEILLKLALYTNQSINRSYYKFQKKTFLSKVTLVNGNSAKTVLYFFLLMLYKVSPCKIYRRGAVVVVICFTFCIHLR